MARDPSFPFYSSDWLGSSRIALMDASAERGLLRLLCHLWANDDCALPDNDDVLARLSLMDQGWFNGGSAVVRDCLDPHPEKKGFVTNLKLLGLKRERQEWKRKSAAGGAKSAQARRISRATNGGTKGGSSGSATTAQTNGATPHQPPPQPIGNSPSPSSSPSPFPTSSLSPLPFNDSCSEPPSASSEPAVLTFPCVGDGPNEFALTQRKLDEYVQSFPGIDVLAECRKARQWCVDTPTKRKTFRGMPKFLSGWLGRAQDSHSTKPPPNGLGQRTERSLAAAQSFLEKRV